MTDIDTLAQSAYEQLTGLGFDAPTAEEVCIDLARRAHDLGAAGEREDATCAQCGNPCCKACSWCHGCKRHICAFCAGSHRGTPNGKNHGGIDPAAIRKRGEQ